jgi:hypothetical protein
MELWLACLKVLRGTLLSIGSFQADNRQFDLYSGQIVIANNRRLPKTADLNRHPQNLSSPAVTFEMKVDAAGLDRLPTN